MLAAHHSRCHSLPLNGPNSLVFRWRVLYRCKPRRVNSFEEWPAAGLTIAMCHFAQLVGYPGQTGFEAGSERYSSLLLQASAYSTGRTSWVGEGHFAHEASELESCNSGNFENHGYWLPTKHEAVGFEEGGKSNDYDKHLHLLRLCCL